MATELPPFHLAIEVSDLVAARKFYGELLLCEEGRSSEAWVDFNFFGHQLVCHQTRGSASRLSDDVSNPVDGHDVPVPHFGAVLDMETWEKMAGRLQDAGVQFLIEQNSHRSIRQQFSHFGLPISETYYLYYIIKPEKEQFTFTIGCGD